LEGDKKFSRPERYAWQIVSLGVNPVIDDPLIFPFLKIEKLNGSDFIFSINAVGDPAIFRDYCADLSIFSSRTSDHKVTTVHCDINPQLSNLPDGEKSRFKDGNFLYLRHHFMKRLACPPVAFAYTVALRRHGACTIR
jgi:hypothetical protein